MTPTDRLPLSALFARPIPGSVLDDLAARNAALTYATRVAIRAACDALGLKPGDEVLVPAYNCGSEIDPLLHAGLKPVLYPVGADTTVDPATLEPLITPQTKALFLTHYFGFPQPHTAALRALCDHHHLALIEDCAHALLSRGPAAVGQTGDVAVFCFSKYLPVNAGGALILNRADLTLPAFPNNPPLRPALKLLTQATAASLLGERGIAALKELRPARPFTQAAAFPDMPRDYYFDPALAGTRISALALAPLRALDHEAAFALRRRNYRAYLDLLGGIDGVTPLIADLPDGVCPLNMPVLVENRDRIAAQLAALGIAANPWWAGYHRALDFTPFPSACALKDHVLSLPLYPALDPRHLHTIVAALEPLLQPN